MNRTITETEKTNWLDGLRSGKYKQGQHCLQSGVNTYCCLGVFCVVNKVPFNSMDTHLPSSVKLDQIIQSDLVTFNDEKSWNFLQIAEWIEKNVETHK